MPPPNPVLIVRLFAQTAGTGTNWSNVSYWSPATAFTASTLQTAADDAFTMIGNALGGCIQTTNRVVLAYLEYLNGSTSLTAGSTGAAIMGSIVGDVVSDQNAVVLRKITGVAGRQNRGRFFVSSLSSAVFDTGNPDELNPAHLSDFQAYAAIYGADQTFGGIVCHSRHWDRKDGTLVPITGMRVSSRIASRDDRRRRAPNLPE